MVTSKTAKNVEAQLIYSSLIKLAHFLFLGLKIYALRICLFHSLSFLGFYIVSLPNVLLVSLSGTLYYFSILFTYFPDEDTAFDFTAWLGCCQ